MEGPVVTWFEDPDTGLDALVYAARAAQARSAPLRLVRPGRQVPGTVLDGGDPRADGAATPDSLDAAVSALCATHPGLRLETSPAYGDPAESLSRAGRDASLLVVPGRRPVGPGGRLPGLTTLRVLSEAECPVAVVRGEVAPAIRRVVVGIDVDAPRDSDALLGFAVAEGLRHSAEVYAIHIWEDPERLYGTDAAQPPIGPASLRESHHKRLAAILEPWEHKHPDMIIAREVFPGSPGRLLVAATRLMDTLVIGGHLRGGAPTAADGVRAVGMRSMRVGDLAQTVLRHARCPVTMVPLG